VRGAGVRTTLHLDEEVLETAMRYSGGKSKTEIVNDALRVFVRRKRLRELLEFRGQVEWTGDLDQNRK
jgi:Arc/MetJ family transcription regulator